MKHRRKLTAALACALAVALGAGAVLANETPQPDTAPPLLIAPAPQSAPAVSEPSAAQTVSGADTSTRKSFIVNVGEVPLDLPVSEDPAGTVSFENLASRMRKKNLNILALDHNIESLEVVDLDEMRSSLNNIIQMLQGQQQQLSQLVDGVGTTLSGLKGLLDEEILDLFQATLVAYPQATIVSLQTQIDSCNDTIKQIEDGSIEDEYNFAIFQMTNLQNQVVMGGQTLYLALLGLEQTQQGLTRNLDALDRTLAQLDVRYEMGQISALTLAEAKAGRTALVSGMSTLEMNITSLRRQLEGMLDEEITGTVQLQPLTAVTAEQLAAVNYEEDLKKVIRYSYELESANKTWYDAEDAYTELLQSKTAADYEVDSAYCAAQAAELSHQATKQSIKLSFAALCDQLLDQQQVLNAAKTTLAVKEDALSAAQLKHSQGTISDHALLDAQDARDEAADAVDTAAIDLFTYFNNYRWAVEYGILN